MIDKFTIDKIYNAAQIVDVVSEFVPLKKRGVNYVGLCPFHDDSSPSFYVSPAKNICKCFACGEGGTATQFIMKHEHVSYTEALHYLAKKYHIEIQERAFTEEEKQMRSDRESMMIVNQWARDFFVSRLYEHEEGRNIGLSYFTERGFREETIRKFQLGYCLNKRDDLYKNALAHGLNESFIFKTGLAYKREDGTVADRFFGRVIFPVHTLSGKVVAFGGRVMGKKEKVAKYINSPDSEVYHKSNELYGIYFAKQAVVKEDKCFLVEGYTDVISMHQTGIENVVASSGTSLTYGQIRLIRRFTSNITVLYDGDEAGINAAIRGIDMLLEEGMNVKVVLLPEGEDPDSFARSHNSFDFTLFIKEHEVDFIRFKAGLLLKKAGHDPIKRVNMIKEMMESVAVIADPVVRSVYIRECCQLLDEREEVLINEVVKIRARRTQSASTTQQRSYETNKPDDRIESDRQTESSPDTEATYPNGEQAMSGETEKTAIASMTRPSPFKKYESALVRYVIRYGERVLFDAVEEDMVDEGGDEKREVKVAEYIHSELYNDDIEIQTPLYKRILEEAVLQCEAPDFVASRYFLSHPDFEISKIAADMTISRYQLSKFFKNTDEFAFALSTALSEEQRKLYERLKKEKEQEEMTRWIVQDLFALKNAYVKQRIETINKQLKEASTDEEKGLELVKELTRLDELKLLINRHLGDRQVTGVGR